jgi:hypothetical protein
MLGLGMPVHTIQLTQRRQACVYSNDYNTKYSNRDRLTSFDGIDDNIDSNTYYYPLCLEVHDEEPYIDPNGVRVWFEYPPLGRDSVNSREYSGNIYAYMRKEERGEEIPWGKSTVAPRTSRIRNKAYDRMQEYRRNHHPEINDRNKNRNNRPRNRNMNYRRNRNRHD